MFDQQIAYCRQGFCEAVAASDLEAARDWCLTLGEFTDDTNREHTVLGSLVVRHQVAQDTCEEHGEFCCQRCFDYTFVSTEPEPEVPAMTDESFARMVEEETTIWEQEADAIQRTLDEIDGLLTTWAMDGGQSS